MPTPNPAPLALLLGLITPEQGAEAVAEQQARADRLTALMGQRPDLPEEPRTAGR